MATTGVTKAKSSPLPKSATITIRDRRPNPGGEVEVTPDGGRIHFENKDKKEYRLRFKSKTDANAGIDVLLPASGQVTILIKNNDEFEYNVLAVGGEKFETGGGGGTIRN